MTMLVVCAVLLIAGLAMVFLEMFVPSAGVLGFLSAACIILSIVLAYYYYGLLIGTAFLSVGVILTPVAIALAVRWYPHTALGQLVMPLPPTPDEVRPLVEITGELRRLKGQIGKTITPLLPGGSVKIEGRVYNAFSESEPIDAGQLVLVVLVDGTRIVVRQVEQSQVGHIEQHKPKSVTPPSDILAQPLEALGLESLDEPLS